MPITDVGALAASTAAGVSSKLPAMAASGESSPASALVAATPALALLLLWSALLLIVLIGWYKVDSLVTRANERPLLINNQTTVQRSL